MKKMRKITVMFIMVAMIFTISSCNNSEENIIASERSIEIANNVKNVSINRLPYPYFSFEYDSEDDWITYIKEEFAVDIIINNVNPMYQSDIINGEYLIKAIKDNNIDGLIEMSGIQLYNINRLKDANLILPLDEFLYDNLEYQALPASIKDAFKSPDGKTWALATQNSFGIFSRIFRKEWLENLDISSPKNLDELYAVSKAFAYNDPNKNGKNDEYGMNINIRESVRNLADIFIANECYLSNLTLCSIAYNPITGTYEDALLQPKMKSALTYVESMLDENIIRKSNDFTFLKSDTCGNFYDILYYFQNSLNSNDWIEVTNITNDEEKTVMAQRPFKAFVLTSNTKKPKETINEFVNIFLANTRGMAIGTYGIENKNFKIANGEIEAMTENRIQLTGLNYEMLALYGTSVKDKYRPEAFMNYRKEKILQFAELYNSNMIFWDSHATIMGNVKISRSFGDAMYQWYLSANKISVDDFINNLIKNAKINGNSDALSDLNSEIGQIAKYNYD